MTKDLIRLIYSISDKLPKYLLETLLNIFGYIFYFISFLITRRKDIWVFGSWAGKRFSDNSKYLFLYVANNHKTEIKSVWISKDKNIVKKLRDSKYDAYYAYEPKGIYYNLRARYIFSDNYFDSVNFWCCGGATKVQLGHGTPLKKVGYDIHLPLDKSIIRFVYIYLKPWLFTKNDYIISPSDFFVNIFASAFRVKKENIMVTGYPRNDLIFDYIRGPLDDMIYDKIVKIKSNNTKLILCMPTFRGDIVHSSNTFADMNFDFEKLNSFLDQINGFFIIKLHPLITNFNCDKNNYNRIIFLPNNFDIYPLLHHIDILVTDYSSIYFDFLLIDRPIIFIPYDLETYLKDERGLYFDYNEFTPGPKSFTFKDLLYWIDRFAKCNDEFIDVRKKIRDISFNYIDGNSSYRIYKFIREIV